MRCRAASVRVGSRSLLQAYPALPALALALAGCAAGSGRLVSARPPGLSWRELLDSLPDVPREGDRHVEGPKALETLKSERDAAKRVAAALVVAWARPEGAWEALVEPLARDDTPRLVRVACLDGLTRMGPAPPGKLALATGAVLRHAEGGDAALARIALLALPSVTDRKNLDQTPAEWRSFVARRLRETAATRELRALFDRLKQEYESAPEDGERIRLAVQDAGLAYQEEVIARADPEDRQEMQDLITKMVRFCKRIRQK